MPMLWIMCVAVRNRARHLLGQMQKERAPLRDVEKLHPRADAQHGHPPLGDLLHEYAVEVFTPLVEQPDAAMQLIAVAPRIEIYPAHEHERESKHNTCVRGNHLVSLLI